MAPSLTVLAERVQAPSEAEAQCAELARGGKVSATLFSHLGLNYLSLNL